MFSRNFVVAGVTAMALAASTGLAMAQATGTENNATSGSSAGVGPNSGADMKGKPDEMKAKPGAAMSGDSTPTTAGTKDEQAKDLRGHSETPTTGK